MSAMVTRNQKKPESFLAHSLFRPCLVLLALGAGCFLFAYALVPDAWVEGIIRYGTKPVFYLVYGFLFCWLAYQVRQHWGQMFTRRVAALVLAAGLGTALICAPHEFGYKVLQDEYIIPAQAKNLHYNGTSDYTTGAFPAYSELQDLYKVVDKRPSAFSALLALIHDVTGYRSSSVFWLNVLVGFGLIFLLLHAATYRLSFGSAWLERAAWVIALAASLPLLGQAATGAGLDLYNAALLFLSAYMGYRVLLEKDQTQWMYPWLAVNFLLFNARYESILYLISCALIILVKAWNQRRMPGYPALLLMPVLLMLYVLRHRVFSLDPKTHWQLNADTAVPFSWGYMYENLGHAVEFLCIPEIQSSASLPLVYLGLPALCLLAVAAGRRWRNARPPAGWSLLAYGSIVIVNLILLLGYHWGRLDEREVSRLSLPLYLLLGVCIVWFIASVGAKWSKLLRVALLIVIGYVFCFSLPGRSTEYGLRGNYYAAVDSWAREKLAAHAKTNLLMITDRPVYWNLYDIAAMNPGTVERGIRGFEFHRNIGTIQPYLLTHYKVDPASGKRIAESESLLETIYETELVGEYGYRAYHVAQLKRIVGLRAGAPKRLRLSPQELSAMKRFPIDFWFHSLP